VPAVCIRLAAALALLLETGVLVRLRDDFMVGLGSHQRNLELSFLIDRYRTLSLIPFRSRYDLFHFLFIRPERTLAKIFKLVA
jgi:hypothetical protein